MSPPLAFVPPRSAKPCTRFFSHQAPVPALALQIFVEVERARLTRMHAKIKEDQGKLDEAAEIMQEVAVRLRGAEAPASMLFFPLLLRKLLWPATAFGLPVLAFCGCCRLVRLRSDHECACCFSVSFCERRLRHMGRLAGKRRSPLSSNRRGHCITPLSNAFRTRAALEAWLVVWRCTRLCVELLCLKLRPVRPFIRRSAWCWTGRITSGRRSSPRRSPRTRSRTAVRSIRVRLAFGPFHSSRPA